MNEACAAWSGLLSRGKEVLLFLSPPPHHHQCHPHPQHSHHDRNHWYCHSSLPHPYPYHRSCCLRQLPSANLLVYDRLLDEAIGWTKCSFLAFLQVLFVHPIFPYFSSVGCLKHAWSGLLSNLFMDVFVAVLLFHQCLSGTFLVPSFRSLARLTSEKLQPFHKWCPLQIHWTCLLWATVQWPTDRRAALLRHGDACLQPLLWCLSGLCCAGLDDLAVVFQHHSKPEHPQTLGPKSLQSIFPVSDLAGIVWIWQMKVSRCRRVRSPEL